MQRGPPTPRKQPRRALVPRIAPASPGQAAGEACFPDYSCPHRRRLAQRPRFPQRTRGAPSPQEDPPLRREGSGEESESGGGLPPRGCGAEWRAWRGLGRNPRPPPPIGSCRPYGPVIPVTLPPGRGAGLGSQAGVPGWGAGLGSRAGVPVWCAGLGGRAGVPGWGAGLGCLAGVPGWEPGWGAGLGCRSGVPGWGAWLGCRAGEPGWGTGRGCRTGVPGWGAGLCCWAGVPGWCRAGVPGWGAWLGSRAGGLGWGARLGCLAGAGVPGCPSPVRSGPGWPGPARAGPG
eukprot:gene10054-biopygen19772